jgi:hypothetical protein
MERKKAEQLVIDSFQFFKSNFLYPDYVYEPSELDKRTISGFLDRLHKKYGLHSVGLEFMVNYFEAQFSYWLWRREHGMLKEGMKYVAISWVIGKKAWDRYFEHMVEFPQPFRDVRTQYEMFARPFFKPVSHTIDRYLEVHDFEEKEKARFHNQRAGMIWCLDETDLYYHKSEWCKKCVHSKACKQYLKMNFPQIYKARGYEKTK